MSSQLSNRIKKILTEGGFDALRAASDQQTLLNIQNSSMDLVLFYVTLEREFGVQFSLEEITSPSFCEMDSLERLLQRKIGSNAASTL